MSKMIQIRNVPDELHGTLKARAARRGLSLSDLLLVELEQAAERLTVEEWLDELATRRPSPPGIDIVGALRADRAAH